MVRTRVFKSGKSQAVRIPKEYRFSTDTAIITQVGSALVLTPENDLASVMREGFLSAPDDFMRSGREDFLSSERESLEHD